MRACRVGLLFLPLALAVGCATPPSCTPADVSADLTARTGHALGPTVPPGKVVFPSGASLADGLTEEEAVAIALWNNANLQELLTELGIARGDLVQANLLPNP